MSNLVAGRLRGRRPVLVVAPHPDDETIGCAALIAKARRAGRSVTVIVVTDGAASHRNSRTYPRKRLVRTRRSETCRAMHRLGVHRGQIEFLGLGDGTLRDRRPADLQKISRAVRRRGGSSLVVGPDPADAHPDHAVTALAVQHAIRNPNRRLAYGVWNESHTSATGRLPLGMFRARKRSILQGYRTQCGVIRDDPEGFALSACDIQRFCGPAERFGL